jgi:hypothetical protein
MENFIAPFAAAFSGIVERTAVILDGNTTASRRRWRTMARYKVESVTLSGGRIIPAQLLICPTCNALDLKTDIDTSHNPWKCRCTKGHEFEVNALIN